MGLVAFMRSAISLRNLAAATQRRMVAEPVVVTKTDIFKKISAPMFIFINKPH